MKLDKIEAVPDTPKDYTYLNEDDGMWYHYDESWDSYGPFETKLAAETALARYIIELGY